MSKELKEGLESTIFIDREKVNEAIEQEGKYQTDEITITKWEGAKTADSYLVEISKSNIKFNGILNKFFEREGCGIHFFENGEKYFGAFKEDKRNSNGVYFWPSVEIDGRIKSELYFGFWKNDQKDNNGIYVWLDEPKKDKIFDNTNMEAYVGRFDHGNYKTGTFLQKIGDDYYLYYGNFTKNGQKNDENGYFYSSKLDKLFHGKIENDIFIAGYVVSFNSDTGEISNIVHSTFDKDLNVSKIIMEKDLMESEKVDECKNCSRFRDVILGIDYFGELYKRIKDITKFVDDNMNNINVFNDVQKFPLMNKLIVSYTKNNIDKDILSKVFENQF